METFPSTEHVLALLAAVLVVLLANRAWTQGVLKMFWAIIGLLLGAASGILCFQYSNAVLPGEELGQTANLMLSIVVALVGYLVFRQLSKSLLQKLFSEDGMLSSWTEGFRGALLSLIPSLFTLLIVLMCLRMSGTLIEMRSAERNCHPESAWLTDNYPGWSMVTEWRDAAERLPFVLEVSEPIDPISRIPERSLVLLLIASKHEGLFQHLKNHGATAPIVNGALFQGLLTDAAIGKLLAERKHTALLRQKKVVDAAGNGVLAGLTRKLELRQTIDDFMLSEARQQRLRSLERPEVPRF